MYNFNTSLSTPLLGVGVDFCSNTPRTPEILNSLIAMTNPFEYSYTSATSQNQTIPTVSSSNGGSINNLFNDTSPVIACKLENSFIQQQYDNNSQSNCSSSSSLESPSTTPLHMASTFASTTPSLQQTRSQLIKAGVKLLIQNKRKNSGSSCDADCKPPPLKIRATSTLSSPTSSSRDFISSIPINNNTNSNSDSSEIVPLTSPKQVASPISVRNFSIKTDSTTSCDEDTDIKPLLTPEDEDRRRRRRERNKIAATKCRLKKRECINNLMRESETLEAQNVELKTQLKSLEEEYKYLTDMWQAHQHECKNLALLGSVTNRNTNNICDGSLDALSELDAALKDTNNNKHLNDQSQLPSLTPLINCNVSFDFY
ncbi:activating transcription factor 3-like isoform X2 [Chironomus tepperi]|uniref:activating transcription factor 3-like isoform X2 n=1 Tax=Chironomus tepperi TaxID=113505 RepID=UPI00391F9E93